MALSKAIVNRGVDAERKEVRSRGRPKKISSPTTSMSKATPATNLDQVQPVEDEAKSSPTPQPTVAAKTQKTRGRPPKVSGLAKQSNPWSSSDSVPVEESKTCAGASTAVSVASELRKSTSSTSDPSAVKFEAEVEDHNISSTSAAAKCLTSPKVNPIACMLQHAFLTTFSYYRHCDFVSQGNEEEIVSSSSSSQNPTKRSVKTQTKPLDMKPSKEWIEKVRRFCYVEFHYRICLPALVLPTSLSSLKINQLQSI